MTRIDPIDVLKFREYSANKGALDWFDLQIKNAKRAVEELENYRSRFVDASETYYVHASPVYVLSSAVNQLHNATNNQRIDLAVSIAAELGVVQHLKSL